MGAYAESDLKQAVRILGSTLVAVDTRKYPVQHGNCCTVETEGGERYRILNFYAENLREAVERGVSWPIRILALSGSHAVVHDCRIPRSWYRPDYCESCTPLELLPPQQALAYAREKEIGAVEERPSGGRAFFADRLPDLRTDEEKKAALSRSRLVIYEVIGPVVVNPSALARVTLDTPDKKDPCLKHKEKDDV